MIASFFSYKGGSGRTTTAYNTLYYLIKQLAVTKDNPLIIIDTDTESAGISYLLLENEELDSDCMKSEKSLQYAVTKGDQEWLSHRGSGKLISEYYMIYDTLIPVGHVFNYSDDSAVLLLKSDISDQKYRLGFSFEQDQREHFADLVQIMKKCKCHVIFDTPSGTQQLANESLSASQSIVCCMRPSYQFQKGTKDFIIQNAEDFSQKKIILCPSAVSLDKITFVVKEGDNTFSRTYPDEYATRLDKLISDICKNSAIVNNGVKIVTDMKDNSEVEYVEKYRSKISDDNLRDANVIGVPEVKRFKWRECCLPLLVSKTDDELLACERYDRLASILKKCCYGD